MQTRGWKGWKSRKYGKPCKLFHAIKQAFGRASFEIAA